MATVPWWAWVVGIPSWLLLMGGVAALVKYGVDMSGWNSHTNKM